MGLHSILDFGGISQCAHLGPCSRSFLSHIDSSYRHFSPHPVWNVIVDNIKCELELRS